VGDDRKAIVEQNHPWEGGETMSRYTKFLIVLALLALLLASTSPILAAYARVTYKPAHWTGLVRKYDAAGQPSGWRWGGGLREPGRGLRWAVNVQGQRLGYKVQVGACYGCVR
jgi:hypothetical protein